MDGCVWREREWGEGSEGREATSHELSSTYLACGSMRAQARFDQARIREPRESGRRQDSGLHVLGSRLVEPSVQQPGERLQFELTLKRVAMPPATTRDF